MAEEFRPGVRRAGWWNAAEGGADGEPRSGTAPSGSCLAGGDLRSYRWPAEAAVSKPIWSWEESADSETFQGPDPTGASGFLNDLTVPTSSLPLSSSTDWSQVLIHAPGPSELKNLSFPGIQHGVEWIPNGHRNLRNSVQTIRPPRIPAPRPSERRFPLSDEQSLRCRRLFKAVLHERRRQGQSDLRWFQGSAMKKTDGGAPALKKPRVETPSPLPSFKVRKEKLGDRITALQQLVSPFGKTDTASVLYEAIEYIKLLHEQVGVLTTPYLKTGPSMQHKRADSDNSSKSDDPKDDLRSRGLCLVPISSTFPVINETTPDFWTPTFGAPYRLER
ncbi:unnamed protein product [Spirodela intermedia]|uniref:BHLH domain-containing protein n=1 Tax=Spirodela intermedia TaxID=51605 RepID=A0A7I8K4I2_SPIIN|nr:unnamed protein product [Spirodela intermedia]